MQGCNMHTKALLRMCKALWYNLWIVRQNSIKIRTLERPKQMRYGEVQKNDLGFVMAWHQQREYVQQSFGDE